MAVVETIVGPIVKSALWKGVLRLFSPVAAFILTLHPKYLGWLAWTLVIFGLLGVALLAVLSVKKKELESAWNFDHFLVINGQDIESTSPAFTVDGFQAKLRNRGKSDITAMHGFVQAKHIPEPFPLQILVDGNRRPLDSFVRLPPDEEMWVYASFSGQKGDSKGIDTNVFLRDFSPLRFTVTIDGYARTFTFDESACRRLIETGIQDAMRASVPTGPIVR